MLPTCLHVGGCTKSDDELLEAGGEVVVGGDVEGVVGEKENDDLVERAATEAMRSIMNEPLARQ